MKVHAFRNAGLNQTSRHFPCYRAVSHLLSLLWDWDGQQASGACRGGRGCHGRSATRPGDCLRLALVL